MNHNFYPIATKQSTKNVFFPYFYKVVHSEHFGLLFSNPMFLLFLQLPEKGSRPFLFQAILRNIGILTVIIVRRPSYSLFFRVSIAYSGLCIEALNIY